MDAAQTNTIYVGNLSWSTDSNTLNDFFKGASLSVTNAEVQYYGNGSRSKGWGLVTFSDSRDVNTAIEKFNDLDLDGRKVVVRADRGSTPKTARNNDYDDAKEEDTAVSTNKIFVGNLTWDTTSEDLEKQFSKFGAVANAEVMTRPDGKSRGWGIVQMDDEKEAGDAVENLDNTQIDGRDIRVEFQRAKTSGARRTRKPRRARDSKMDQEAEPSNAIFVGNLPWSYSNDDLEDMFSKYGATDAEIKVGYDGRSRGYGVVTFKSVNDASSAINGENGTDCGGRNVVVRFNRA